MSILKTENLKKYYGSGENQVKALDGVDLEIAAGEFVAVVGTSGSGKSTLLHMMGGLDRATSGRVWIDGNDIFSMKDEELTIFRRRNIGFVFQNYNLVPVLNVYENIVLPVELDGHRAKKKFTNHIIELLGLSGKVNQMPNQLSGGQQQRVSIARALAGDPSLILADEPTGALDSRTSREVLNFLKELNEEGNTIVMITHDNTIALEAKHVVRIHDGKINFDGDVKDYAAIIQAGNEKHLEQ